MTDSEKIMEQYTSPAASQHTTDESVYDIMDNASIVSETTMSTVISRSNSNSKPLEDGDEAEVEFLEAETTIDWDGLAAVEKRMVCEDEDIALFLERLDQAKDDDWEESHLPVQSIDHLKEIIANSSHLPFNDIPNIPSINYDDSELSLWSALLAEYRQVALKIPKYASIMVRSGIPPALRGLAWKSMSEAAAPTLGSLYDSLAAEWTPFVKIIGRDLNRTFPEISMFREKGGEGQMKLGRVLRAYSAYDMQVGYCQGLTFLTGPLLLHMSDRDAFCVLVKLMEDYELRSMFTADMSGLQLRMYQFECLFAEKFPDLYQHFSTLGINNIYASQWFLSFFAVTCPLGMLVRIFDLTFAEGAVTTLMRVALAVLKRNKHILMAFDDEEQILQHMLGRCLWDSYGLDADLLMTDVSSITECTNLRLRELDEEFRTGPKPIRPRRDSCKPATISEPAPAASAFSSFPFNFMWPVAAATPIPEEATTKSKSPNEIELRHSVSGMSIKSFDSENSAYADRLKQYQSSASSFSSNDLRTSRIPANGGVPASSDTQALKDQIAALTAEVEKLKYELQNRDRLELEATALETEEGGDNNTTITGHKKSDNPCCEGLRMKLALAKTNEVLARQEIESLKHSLHTKTGVSTNQIQAAPVSLGENEIEEEAAATPEAVPAAPAEPAAPAAKGWSLW